MTWPTYNLGLALADNGQADEAIAQYQKALEINPGNAEAHNNLGLALLDRGQIGEAIAQYRQAQEDQARLCGGPQQSRPRFGGPRTGR